MTWITLGPSEWGSSGVFGELTAVNNVPFAIIIATQTSDFGLSLDFFP